MTENATEDQRAPRWRRPAIALAVVIACAGLAWLAVSVFWPYRPGEVTGDDLDIRLVGVWHECYDDVFDASGKRIGKTLGADHPFSGSQNTLKRSFIFELPRLAKDDFEYPSMRILPVDSAKSLSLSKISIPCRSGRIIIGGNMSTTYLAGWPLDWKPLCWKQKEHLVERVDAELTYWSGPRGAAEITFEGPFEAGKPVLAVHDASATATLATFYRTGWTWGTLVTIGFSASREPPPVFVYDGKGRRHQTWFFWRGTGPPATAVYLVSWLAPEQITAITVGEGPRTRMFHNIAVVYPDAPERDRPQYREVLEDRYGVAPGSSDFHAGDSSEAAGIMEAVRGPDVIRACRAFSGFLRDAREMSEAERARIVAVVETWSRADDPEIRKAAILFGIEIEFERFIGRALELCAESDANQIGGVAQAIAYHPWQLSGEHLTEIKEIILTHKPWRGVSNLVSCLAVSSLPEASQGLAELATDERSHLWWWPLSHEGVVAGLGPREKWPPLLKARYLVTNGYDSLDGRDRDEALDYLPSLLSEDLAVASPRIFTSLLDLIAERYERDAATEIFVGYLAGKSPDISTEFTVAIITRYVNLWNGIDIGGLGADQAGGLHPGNWREVADAVLRWHRTGEVETPVPEGYRAGEDDLRVILYDPENAEGGLIGLWRNERRTDRAGGVTILESADALLAVSFLPRVAPTGAAVGAGGAYLFDGSLRLKSGGSMGWPTGVMARSDLPCVLDAGPGAKGVIERADSPESVLSGTKVFEDWWEEYGPDVTEEVPADTPTSVIAPEDEMDKRKEALLERIER